MKYVVLGSSAAGINGARELRKLNPEAEIVLISKDKHIYSRCILHHYLGNTRDVEGLNFAEKNFEELCNINFIKGRECTSLDTDNKKVILDDGSSVEYDKLLIATGAHTFFPPILGLIEANNVIGFRNIEDIEKLKELAVNSNNIVIMGAGLVGLDALSGFLHMGKKATVVEMGNRALSKQLDKRAAATYEDAFKEQGIKFYFEAGISEVIRDENDNVKSLKLSNGESIDCDLLVITAGVRSNTAFLKDSGVEVNKMGLVIDFLGRTSIEDIYGAGDVTGKSPIWPAAVKEGIVAAKNMSRVNAEMVDFFASKSTMNFLGIPSMSIGICDAPDDSYSVDIFEDASSYKKIIHKDGEIFGAVIQGDLSYGGILTQLISRNIDVSKVKKPLFKIDYSDFFNIKSNFEFYYGGEFDE